MACNINRELALTKRVCPQLVSCMPPDPLSSPVSIPVVEDSSKPTWLGWFLGGLAIPGRLSDSNSTLRSARLHPEHVAGHSESAMMHDL